ncbi:MAG: 3-isopropylmalate dehydrogenase [Acidimicrobiaceae bacterium]|nr:3-isopropylmalate dehydrogenase [Acidimicrobiaceae bacterium]
MGGDGIGPDLVRHATRALLRLGELDGFEVELIDLPNSGAHYRSTGVLLDDDTLDALRSCESLLFGAAGDPELPPGFVERALILDVSRFLDLHVGVRAAYLYDERFTPLKSTGRGDIDLVIVRDTTEGELPLPGGRMHQGTPYEAAASVLLHTRHGVERSIRYAFDVARTRRGRVSLVAQSNVLVPHQLWEDVLRDVAAEQPDIDVEALYPDHAAMKCVTEPKTFDVIVTNLLFGGVLTDLIAGVVGGMGLIGSSRVNTETGFGMFEPAHGSAPKYTGMNVVSPVATFRALAMLLDNIGEPRAASRLEAAIDESLASGAVAGVTTRSGTSTSEAADVIIDSLAMPGAERRAAR